jgi:hypothetical protein
MDTSIVIDQIWDGVAEKLSTLQPRQPATPRNRRERDAETNKVIRHTTRLGLHVSAAIYNYIGALAQARSLDRSRLVQLIGMGAFRIRQGTCPDIQPPFNKIIQFTITDQQQETIQELMIAHRWTQGSALSFAVAATLGEIAPNPDAPVFLTTQEESLLGRLACALELAEDCVPPPAIMPELERAHAALRSRFEQYGLQPTDEAKTDAFSKLVARLTDEIRLAIYQPGIDELWCHLVGMLAGIGVPDTGRK